MTDLPITTLKFNEATHRYWLDGKAIPGVSGVLDRGYAMGGLDRWAAEQIADFVDHNWESLQKDIPKTRYWRVRKAADAVKKARGDRGTDLHKLIELELASKSPEPPEVPPHLKAPFFGWLEWWYSSGLQALQVERKCASRAAWVAGTLDCLARDAAGDLWLLDWKSTNKVRTKHGIQAEAYSEMEFFVNDLNQEEPMPPSWVLRLGIVHIEEDQTSCFEAKGELRQELANRWRLIVESSRSEKLLKNLFEENDHEFPRLQGHTNDPEEDQ